VHCDALVSVPKSMLTQFVGSLSVDKLRQLHRALVTALDVDVAGLADPSV